MRRVAAFIFALVIIPILLSTSVCGQCVGDCSPHDQHVSVDEVAIGVNIALGHAPTVACDSFDVDGDGMVRVNELIKSVDIAANAVRLTATGTCMRPGQTQSLVPCANGTKVQVFRCDDLSRCLGNPAQLSMVASGSAQDGGFTLSGCALPDAPLVFAAKVDPEADTDYRIIDFGIVGVTGAASLTRLAAGSDVMLEGIVLNPISEAAVQLLDESGLEHFNPAGAQEVIDAVETANAQTSFTGQTPSAAAMLATDTASNDPVVQDTIDANRMGPTFAIQMLGAGPTTADPSSGIRVIRHDPISGAVLADMLTDANGIADFGDVGSDHVTFSIVSARRPQIFTFVQFPISAFSSSNPFRFNNVDLIDRPDLATVDVTLTNLPTGVNQVHLFAGGFQEDGGGTNGSSADIPDFTVDQLQADGKISLLATALDSMGVARSCGSSVDLDPAAVNNQTIAIATNAPPTRISFTASEPVFLDGAQILRKGVIFDLFDIEGQQAPVSNGTFNFCGLPGAAGFGFSLLAPETSSTSAKRITMMTSNLVTSLNATLPSLSISNLTRSTDGKTISWTRSGNDLAKLDVTATNVEWTDGGTDHQWQLVTDPAVTSVTVPALPADLSDFVPPATAVGIRVNLFGSDFVNGLSDLAQRLSATGEDFNVLQFSGSEVVEAERNIPLLSINKDGSASGTVRSTPPGIDCGQTCAANFPPGSTVILTAIPDPGSVFAFWSGDCGGNSTQISVDVNDVGFCTATFD